MARAHSIASFRPGGFALLKPASRPRLNSARIITMSGTIALNTLAMGLLMMPLTLPAPLPLAEPDSNPELIWIDREKPKPPVEAEIVREIQQPRQNPTTTPPRATTQAPVATASTPVISQTGSEQAIDNGPVDTGTTVDIAPIASGPAAIQLQYRSAPAPVYPRMAMQRGITGTVLLQVLVGIDGRPIQVTVAQSSGSRELDDAARAQVLKRWSFQPATRDGQTVQAIGMVPIEFSLR